MSDKIQIKRCGAEGCDRTSLTHPNRFGYYEKADMVLCGKHKQQLRLYGAFLNRTVFDRNEIVNYKDYAEVVLYNDKNKEIAKTKIDLNCVELLLKHKWYLGNNGYVMSRINKKLFLLHRFLLKPKRGELVDHINRDRMDNRMCNLRIVDNNLNNFNKGKQSSNTSGYVGVSWNDEKNKWLSRICVNNNTYFLGYFTNIEDAIKSRHNGELKYYGELRNSENDKNTVFK